MTDTDITVEEAIIVWDGLDEDAEDTKIDYINPRIAEDIRECLDTCNKILMRIRNQKRETSRTS